MAEQSIRQPLNPDGVSKDAPSLPGLYGATLRAVSIVRRSSTDALVSKRLEDVAACLKRLDLAQALREIDRTWRHMGSECPAALASIYGRLLALEDRDHSATLAMLEKTSDGGPDPEIAALIAWAEYRSGQYREACQHIGAALAAFCTVPGDLPTQVAGSIAFGISTLPSVPGWMGLGPDLALHGEILARETDPALDVALNGKAAFTRLIPCADRAARLAFTLSAESLMAPSRIDVSLRGDALLGSDLRYPPTFAVDGRSSVQHGKVTGWARLGWWPARRPRVMLTDEQGIRRKMRLAARPLDGHRWPFTIDLHAERVTGERFELSVELPGVGWQPLPDSPLLMERALHCRKTRAPSHHLPRKPTARPATDARVRPVDIIVPVYRGREETLACIDSVMRTVGEEARFIIVDDATDEPGLVGDLDKLARESAVTLLRNPCNQGFVRSVNRALAVNPGHDVIILNSDAVVFGDWLQRLRSAAYSEQRVGTVTPLSNSGSIASYPSAAGSLMPIERAEEMHQLAARTHPGVRAEIPVGVGFCLYVRRDCLLDVGTLDEATFDKGYGEETDFCLRARQRGWSHILAADVFVHHSGGLSFGSRRAALLERSQRLLNLRYPGYDALIAKFLASDPVAPLRRRLDERRLLALRTPVVLIVTLALTGGVDRFVKAHCEALRQQGKLPLLLRPAAAGDRRRCELSTSDAELPNLTYTIPSELQPLRNLLRAMPIDRAEIQHFLHLDARVIEIVRELAAPYDIFLHDYAWICPRITLIDGSGRYCGEPNTSACDRCVRRNGSVLEENLSVAALRTRSRRWIQQARDVFAPSADTATRIGRYTGRNDINVEPHSHPSPLRPPRPKPRQRDVTRVALIGAIGTHKGYRQLMACARDARKRHLSLEFVVVGYTENDAPLLATGKVFITGRYGEGEACHLLEREDVDVAWFPSVWPETWCYTLDEALQAALPIVTFDIGALAERLHNHSEALLLPLSLEPRQINDHLLRVGNSMGPLPMTPFKSKTRIPRVNETANRITKQPAEPILDRNSDSQAQASSQGGLTAAVQVLPLPTGLYLFSVKAATPSVADVAGSLSLPAVHVGLGPGIPSDAVEFVAGPATHGRWLFAAGDLLVTKVKESGATLVLTSMRAPGGEALSIKVERLGTRADAPPTAAADHRHSSTHDEHGDSNSSDDEALPINIGAHIRTKGDMMFSAVPWAGRIAPGLWIESFSIKPLECFSAQDIEYKALTGNGFETPWLSEEKMCGTKGMSTPLLGFAIRLKPSSLAAAYDCEYSGYFQSGHTVGPLRNGVPCRSSVASDPLEGIQVRLIKRSATMSPTVSRVVAKAQAVVAPSTVDSAKKKLSKKELASTPRRSAIRDKVRSSRHAASRRS